MLAEVASVDRLSVVTLSNGAGSVAGICAGQNATGIVWRCSNNPDFMALRGEPSSQLRKPTLRSSVLGSPLLRDGKNLHVECGSSSNGWRRNWCSHYTVTIDPILVEV